MPKTYLNGTAVKGGLTGTAANGKVNVLTVPYVATASGAATVDRRLFKALYARVRGIRADVYVDTLLQKNLVDQLILTESLTTPITYAEFVISDKKVAFFNALSIGNGDKVVGIDLFIGALS